MKSRFCYALAAAFLMLAPRPLAAQFDAITALFKEVHSITLYGQGAYVEDPNVDGESECAFLSGTLCGIGTEVLIDVGGSGAGSHVELGLGASFLRGLTSKRGDMEFNAGIRSFPTISAYITDVFPQLGALEVYTGASIGLIDLQNAQTYDTNGVERGVAGSTFEFGVPVGFYVDLGGPLRGAGVFAEGSYRWRRFASLDYTLVDADSGRTPSNWPRELDLSGATLALGLQFRLKQDPKPVPMLWTLATADAQAPPATVAAMAGGQRQVLFGMLTLTPDTAKAKRDTAGTYHLEVHSRSVTLGAEGVVQEIDRRETTGERGRYLMTAARLTLTPDSTPAPPSYHADRVGDEFLIRHRQTGAVLRFHRPGTAPPAKTKDEDGS